MNSYNKSIIPIIEAKYDSLTNVEKNIADFFINPLSSPRLKKNHIPDFSYSGTLPAYAFCPYPAKNLLKKRRCTMIPFGRLVQVICRKIGADQKRGGINVAGYF